MAGEASAAAAEAGSSGGTLFRMLRALGTMLGVHIQYAQREARGDLGRVLGAVLVLILGLLMVFIALLFGHVALVVLLRQQTSLDLLRALGVVAGGDLLVGVALLMTARARLRKPILKETRSLVRQTAKSLVEL